MADGIGCKCCAYNESECGCDADWTPQPISDLREQNKALLLTLDKARESLAECDEAMGYMSEYDIPLCMPDRVKSALEAIAPYAEAIKKAKSHV